MEAQVAIGVAAVAVLYAGKRYFQGPRCTSNKSLEGKTVVITGANTGIGKETAVDLAKRGARVIIGCRNVEKGKQALKEIQERSGNKDVFLEKLDLASLESVRTFADNILKSEPRLDFLINNAAVGACPYQKTEDGFEMQFGVNHLGHFLLTMLLLDRLKRSQPSRIINVACYVDRLSFATIKFDDLHHERRFYSSTGAHWESKLANVLFTLELSKRLESTHVTVNAVHPGAVRTELARHHSFFDFENPLRWYFCKSPEQGAQTSIHCAVSEEMEGVSGKYLKDCHIVEPSKRSLNGDTAKKLWEVSMKLVGLEK